MPAFILNMPEVHRERRGHRFYPTPRELTTIPAIYQQDGKGEGAIVYAHYFSSWGDWYMTELDPKTGEAFGWACLGGDHLNGEWGYFDIVALESHVPTYAGTLVERDLTFTPAPAREVLPSGRRTLRSTED
ncbi:DUF2958 domain-containing protein [Streptomyces mobaraensis]|uniref:DUF2958 domain-containing protein n=1 Tax=Streptomyces mobaraensis TaxID=35621 RepID=UPI0012AC6069|nr:hypothetical protein [Streptomyces mobaraensis]